MKAIRLIEELLQDMRYGRRLLTRNPGFTLIAIVTLARDWRQHRYIQHRQCVSAAPAAVRRC